MEITLTTPALLFPAISLLLGELEHPGEGSKPAVPPGV